MKKSTRFKIKAPRIVEESKLEKMYDGSENWLDKYLLEFTAENQFSAKKRENMEERFTQSRLNFDDDEVGWKPSSIRKKEASTIYWKLDEPDFHLEDSEDSLKSFDEDEFCCHQGCSFVYNVQESCLERPSFVMESVPQPTYLKIASLFGMDPHKTIRTDGSNRCKIGHQDSEDDQVENLIRLVETEIGCRTGASMDNQVEVGTFRNSIRDDKDLIGPVHENPYLKYMKRTGPKAHLASARNNLGRRSEEITKSIVKDFLEWFKSIGGEDEETTIDEAILQDLFQIGFDSPTARAIALRIKEMPVVPESLANIRNEPEFAVKKGLKALVKMDIQLEQRPPKLFAFGTMLPKEKPSLRFQPPRNQIKKTWTECERVPLELESLKVVWEGIENLRSTIAFSNWLKNHPDIKPPGYLKEKGLLNINYDEWMQMFKGFERVVESEGADTDSRPMETSEDPLLSTQRTKYMRMDDYMYKNST